MNDEFSRLHPVINFLYFFAVIAFSAIYMNPIMIVISLFFGFLYSINLGGLRSVRFGAMTILPIALFAAVVNIAFNHNGLTVLTYFPSGNPLTLESIIFGVCAAALLSSVIQWFYCFSRVITADKFMYLFGKIIPSLSLVLSITLRYIPRLKQQHKTVSDAQNALEPERHGIISKIRHGARVFSIMLTWSLENSIITADSMSSRGYGLKGRTAFSNYRFYFRDMLVLVCTAVLIAAQICLTVLGCADTEFYPYFEFAIHPVSAAGYMTYAALCAIPLIINLTEEIKWNYFQSRI